MEKSWFETSCSLRPRKCRSTLPRSGFQTRTKFRRSCSSFGEIFVILCAALYTRAAVNATVRSSSPWINQEIEPTCALFRTRYTSSLDDFFCFRTTNLPTKLSSVSTVNFSPRPLRSFSLLDKQVNKPSSRYQERLNTTLGRTPIPSSWKDSKFHPNND